MFIDGEAFDVWYNSVRSCMSESAVPAGKVPRSHRPHFTPNGVRKTDTPVSINISLLRSDLP